MPASFCITASLSSWFSIPAYLHKIQIHPAPEYCSHLRGWTLSYSNSVLDQVLRKPIRPVNNPSQYPFFSHMSIVRRLLQSFLSPISWFLSLEASKGICSIVDHRLFIPLPDPYPFTPSLCSKLSHLSLCHLSPHTANLP